MWTEGTPENQADIFHSLKDIFKVGEVNYPLVCCSFQVPENTHSPTSTVNCCWNVLHCLQHLSLTKYSLWCGRCFLFRVKRPHFKHIGSIELFSSIITLMLQKKPCWASDSSANIYCECLHWKDDWRKCNQTRDKLTKKKNSPETMEFTSYISIVSFKYYPKTIFSLGKTM